MRWTPVVVVLAACTNHVHEVNVSLADLAQGSISVSTTADVSVIQITLAFAVSECPSLDAGLRGTLDGAPLEVLSRGQYIGGIPDCEIPKLQAYSSPSPAATSEIVLTDDAATVTASLAELRVVRAYSIVGTVHPGADARFAWSASTDSVEKGAQPGVLWSPLVGSELELGPAFGSDGVSIDGTALVASIPATASTGAGDFDFSPLFGPTFTSCAGIGHCESEPVNPDRLAATIAP